MTLALLATAAAAAQTGPIIGDAFVVDGDTIEIAGKRIQLSGVDAPEDWQFCLDQTGADYQCGKESSLALDAFLSASRPTRCESGPRPLRSLCRHMLPSGRERRQPVDG
ncbi:putative periplasmic protein (plasmid) [Sinorhizobium fredii CCBAU 25509]|nr:putative periplasmic protein [Sinorhizobium fredii CCBAU 25509]